MSRVGRVVGLALLGLLVAAAGGWGVLALAYAGPPGDVLRTSLAAAFALASLAALVALWLRRWRVRALTAYLVLLVLVLAWWRGIVPSNDRDWQPDVAVLPYATVEGDVFTFHNIRNFDYRSETDYTPAYYDRRFDLRQLKSVDLVAAYWMGPAVAHVFLSFGFAGDEHLAISIETRKEKGEGYSAVGGFFRQYELFYVVADERDVIRLRTNFRRDPPEDVHLYRLQGKPENARKLFVEYVKRINSLRTVPEFYNTLTTNCTTNIWLHSLINPEHLPFSWKVLASGYVPEYLYGQGRLDAGATSFAALQESAHINVRARAADGAADFSRRIREPAAGPALRGMPPKS